MKKMLFATIAMALPLLAEAMDRRIVQDGLIYEVEPDNTRKLMEVEEGYAPHKVVIPSDVSAIDERAFFDRRMLDEITFKEGSRLRRIGDGAFCHTSIEKIQIPASVEFIGKATFFYCRSLCEITFEEGSKLQRIEDGAFRYTDIKTIQIPSSVEFIGERVFSNCQNLREVRLEEGSRLHTIGDGAF
jgi:hypothetical protein